MSNQNHPRWLPVAESIWILLVYSFALTILYILMIGILSTIAVVAPWAITGDAAYPKPLITAGVMIVLFAMFLSLGRWGSSYFREAKADG